ncbi:hypothetical protein Dimus_022647, partial [Dionaea muscipula]
ASLRFMRLIAMLAHVPVDHACIVSDASAAATATSVLVVRIRALRLACSMPILCLRGHRHVVTVLSSPLCAGLADIAIAGKLLADPLSACHA